MKRSLLILATLLLATQFALGDPTTKPAPSIGELTLQATQAFNRGQYAVALPILQKVSAQLKGEPEKAGPIDEMIRVSQKAIATASLQQNATQVDPSASAEHRVPHPVPVEGQIQEMAIKELGNFEYDADKGGNIPEDVKKLSGSQVRLRGYMIPIDQAERISKFALVPSLFQCCYGQPPQLQHTIIVDCPAGKAVSYFPDEISVEGTLTVEEKKDDDIITSIFQVKTSSVKPAPK